MQLDQITLAGITRFTEPTTLSLLDVPLGSVVAIVGDNGEGKTTLLDAVLAPLFLTMPSRRGKLPTYATGSDSFLEGTYQVGDMLVRARVAIDGPRRSIKPVLDISHANGQRNVSHNASVKDYQRDIAQIFPPLELALASAFAPQNRAGSFVTATSAERKELFGICLGLEQYAAWAETANRAVQLVRTAAARLDGRRLSLVSLSSDSAKAALLERLEAAGVLYAEHTRTIEALELELDQVRATREELAARVEVRARAESAHRAAQEAATRAAAEGIGILREQDERHARAGQARQAADSARAAQMQRIAELEAKARGTRDDLVGDLTRRIAGNQTLNARADQIRKAAAEKADAIAKAGAAVTAQDAYQRELEDQAEGLAVDQRNLGPLEKAAGELEEAQRQVAIVEHVPCQGKLLKVVNLGDEWVDVDGAACQFLKDATAAGRRILELEERVVALPTARRAVETRQAVIAGLRQSLGGCRRDKEAAEAIVRQVSELAAYGPELEKTAERIAGYQAQIDQADKALAERVLELEHDRSHAVEGYQAAIATLERELLDDLTALEARARTAMAANAEADDALRAAAAELEGTATVRDELREQDGRLEVLGREVRKAEAERARQEAAVQTIQEELAALARHRLTLAQVETNLAAATEEARVWELLAKCFSRDGLPTLEIGNAGPTVSSLTNELLEVAFGPRFTVEVVTQVPTADGKGLKEDFTIRVYDNEDEGRIRDIADLSGGERVLVEEALRAAIMVFVNHQNRTPFRTICRDETTGALDAENAVRYVAMLRRLVGLAGAAHCLFITHNPQCAELADVVVTVADGRLDVRRTAA